MTDRIVVGRLQPTLTTDQVRQGVSFGMDLLTKPYDNSEILRIAMRIAFRVGRRTRDRKFICSELVDECFRAAGIRFARPDNYVSPQDIWRDHPEKALGTTAEFVKKHPNTSRAVVMAILEAGPAPADSARCGSQP